MKRPTYIPNSIDSFLLIKFFDSNKYREDFINGLLYMNNLGFFHRSESNRGGQFDFYEGTQQYFHSTNEFQWLPKINKGELWFSLQPYQVENLSFLVEGFTGRQANIEKKLFCMYTLWGDSVNKRFIRFNEKISKEFGQFAVIIRNTPLFIKRIEEQVNQLSQIGVNSFEMGFVNYFNQNNTSPAAPMGVFSKFEDYLYQQEFRISLDVADIKGPYTGFHLKISDISLPIDTKDLVNRYWIDPSEFIFGSLD